MPDCDSLRGNPHENGVRTRFSDFTNTRISVLMSINTRIACFAQRKPASPAYPGTLCVTRASGIGSSHHPSGASSRFYPFLYRQKPHQAGHPAAADCNKFSHFVIRRGIISLLWPVLRPSMATVAPDSAPGSVEIPRGKSVRFAECCCGQHVRRRVKKRRPQEWSRASEPIATNQPAFLQDLVREPGRGAPGGA